MAIESSAFLIFLLITLVDILLKKDTKAYFEILSPNC